MLTLSIASENGARTIALDGELDLANAGSLETELQAALADGVEVIVDLTELTFIDSTGIALLVATVGQVADDRLGFVPSSSDSVNRVLQLTGVDRRLPLAG